jgi:hypothetical protein
MRFAYEIKRKTGRKYCPKFSKLDTKKNNLELGETLFKETT